MGPSGSDLKSLFPVLHHLSQICSSFQQPDIIIGTTKDRKSSKKNVQLSQNKPKHICTICSQGFSNRKSFSNHKREHHEDYNVCCGFIFKYPSHYARHLESKTHLREFKCKMCKDVFHDLKDFQNHRKESHFFTGTKFFCPLCGKVFATNGTKNTHMKRVHLKSMKYECGRCPSVFTCKFALSRHYKSVHKPLAQAELFTCVKCNRQFVRKDSLLEHMKLHQKGKVFSCSDCTLTFKDQDEFEKHKVSHEPCDFCGLRIYGGKRARQRHINRHLSVSPQTDSSSCSESPERDISDLDSGKDHHSYSCKISPEKDFLAHGHGRENQSHLCEANLEKVLSSIESGSGNDKLVQRGLLVEINRNTQPALKTCS